MHNSSFSKLLFFTAIGLAGFALLPRLSVQWLPEAQWAVLHVQYGWSGASPEALERAVTTPLEGGFSLLPGIKKISSTSRRDGGYISLELEKNADVEWVRFEASAIIRRIWPQLPEGVSYPVITLSKPEEEEGERPLLTYALSANASPSELYQYANERLAPQLAATPGIGRIEIVGGNRMEWVVRYDEERLAALHLSKNDLLRALRQQFQKEALGLANTDVKIYPVVLGMATPAFFSGNITEENSSENQRILHEKSQLESIWIGNAGSRLVRLGDVAQAYLQEQKPQHYYRINGRNSLRLLLFPEPGTNQIRTARQAKSSIDAAEKTLPAGYSLLLEDDGSEPLRLELKKIFQRTGLSLLILLAFSVLVYRRWKYVLLIISSLIVNLGIAFIFYDLLDVELHVYALAGITLSFGLVIDNSMIMAHHLATSASSGSPVRQVFPTLLACTLAAMTSLVVLFFLDETWRIQLADFAAVILINLAVSLAVALGFVPALMDKMQLISMHRKTTFQQLRKYYELHRVHARILQFLLRWRKTAITAIVLFFGLPIFLLPSKIEGWEWYNHVFGSEYYREKIKPYLDKMTGGTLRLFSQYVWESSGWRQPAETLLFVEGSLPFGSTTAQLNDVFRQVENHILPYLGKDVRQFTTEISSGQRGKMTIQFPKTGDPAFPYILRSRLIAFSLNLGGVKWNIYGVGQGFSNDVSSMPPRYYIVLRGYNQMELQRLAERLAKKLDVNPRVQKLDTDANLDWWEKDLFEFEMRPDPLRLAERNISLVQLAGFLDEYNLSSSPDLYSSANVPVRLENNRLEQHDLWLLQHYTQKADSLAVYFPDLTNIEKRKVATSIHKENQQYLRLLAFEYSGSAHFGQRHLDNCLEELRREMPLGYSAEQTRYEWGSGKRKQYEALFLAMLLLFFICAIQFNSLRQGFANLVLIPISFIGIFLTFYWGDFYFDQGGYASFLLVSGQVVAGLILIVSDYNRFSKIQKNRSETALFLKAFRQKIIPILLAVISTVLGLLPFMLLGEQEVFWFSLAVGAAGGLLFSLVAIIFFVPLFLLNGISK